MQTSKQYKVDIIGRGNVATHLHRALRNKNVDAILVNPHTLDELRENTDFALISVTDNAISEIAYKLSNTLNCNTIVAHTSGSTSISVLSKSALHFGVFYPMQTFSKDVELDYLSIPFFIEGNDEETTKQLMDLAYLISDNCRVCNSEQRRKLHVASVFCCNFTNRLWALSDKYLADNGLDFQDMLPLILETVRKVKGKHPQDVQTGPAVRKDMNTIESHLSALSEYPEMQDIYKTLSFSIINS